MHSWIARRLYREDKMVGEESEVRPFKLKLINLQEGNFKKGLFGAIKQPPLVHGTLAALIPEDLDIDVEIIDEQIEPIDFDVDCDAVAFSVTAHIAKKSYDYAREFRKRKKIVILGGYHVTLCPDEAQEHADSIVTGEAEVVWPQLLRDLIKGDLKRRYVSEGPVDLSQTPIPRRDLLKLSKYVLPNTIIATRGCPYMCTYCASSKIFGGYRRRDSDIVVEEIRSMSLNNWKDQPVSFVDDELFFPKEGALEFLKKLEKLNIKWGSQTTVTTLLDRELVEAAAKAGCVGLMVGVESFNPETHKSTKKYQNLKADIGKAVEYANSLGINVGALMLLGLDTDTPETVRETMNMLKKSRFTLVDFSLLRAYPNTPIYDSLLRENRVRENWWLDDSPYEDSFNDEVPCYLEIYLKPKHFTPGELQIEVLKCEYESNSIFSCTKLGNWARCFVKGDKLINIRILLLSLFLALNAKIMLRKIKKLKNREMHNMRTKSAAID